jgi:hypothetical protein
MFARLKEDQRSEDEVIRCLRMLATYKVNVGLTSSASERSRFLMAIHEHGSPIMHIPARPVIGPALASARARVSMSAAMGRAVAAALSGNASGVILAMEDSGKAGVSAIHAYIDAGVPPPNAPVTVHGGWVYNRVAKVSVHVEGKGFNKPLYHTGELYNDFDYEIAQRE